MDKNYKGHKFVLFIDHALDDYRCNDCMMYYYEYPNYFSIRWSHSEFEIFSRETLLTCEEVQIKKLLE